MKEFFEEVEIEVVEIDNSADIVTESDGEAPETPEEPMTP